MSEIYSTIERSAITSQADQEVLDFERIFRRFSSYVAVIGVRMLGQKGEVEDFIQDVFLIAHRHLGELRDPRLIRAWLRRIALRVAIRMLRRRRVRLALGLDVKREHQVEMPDRAATPEQRFLLAEVFRALDDIPAAERDPSILRVVEGVSIDGVAKRCGCSPTTAKRRVRAASAKLHARLAG